MASNMIAMLVEDSTTPIESYQRRHFYAKLKKAAMVKKKDDKLPICAHLEPNNSTCTSTIDSVDGRTIDDASLKRRALQ